MPELPTHISQEDGTRDMFESVFHAMDYNDDKVSALTLLIYLNFDFRSH